LVLNPFRSSPDATTSVDRELSRLHLPSEGYRVEPGVVYRDLTIGGQNVRLTRDEQRAYQESAGKLAFGQLYLAMADPAWKASSDEDKRKYIHQVYAAAREQARNQVFESVQQRAKAQLQKAG
jgi:hypothetical protein